MLLKFFHAEAVAIISSLKYKNFRLVNFISQNFQQCENLFLENIRNTKDAVLWLWKLHNSVNIRLKGNRHPGLDRFTFKTAHSEKLYIPVVRGFIIKVKNQKIQKFQNSNIQ